VGLLVSREIDFRGLHGPDPGPSSTDDVRVRVGFEFGFIEPGSYIELLGLSHSIRFLAKNHIYAFLMIVTVGLRKEIL
jgi:hypothetical protein